MDLCLEYNRSVFRVKMISMCQGVLTEMITSVVRLQVSIFFFMFLELAEGTHVTFEIRKQRTAVT